MALIGIAEDIFEALKEIGYEFEVDGILHLKIEDLDWILENGVYSANTDQLKGFNYKLKVTITGQIDIAMATDQEAIDLAIQETKDAIKSTLHNSIKVEIISKTPRNKWIEMEESFKNELADRGTFKTAVCPNCKGVWSPNGVCAICFGHGKIDVKTEEN